MGISYYFMDKANKQVGPLSLDELKQRGITRETPVWREGMPNWVQAKDIPELQAYIVTPKPYINEVQLILILCAIFASILFLLAGFRICRLVVWHLPLCPGNCHPHHRGTRYRLFPVLQKKKIPTEYNTGSSTLFTIFLIFHFLLWNAKSCLPFPAWSLYRGKKIRCRGHG